MEEKENTVILTDEDGVDSEFEIVTILNVDNHEYCVLYPTDSDDKGDDMLTEIEDDDEFEKVAEAYDEWAEENEEYGEYPDEDEDTDDDEE
jgi:uncharacterized protein YrzB (UPF0473 family)